MKFKIAVVQMDVKFEDPEYNLKKAEGFVKKAFDRGAQLVVFPENFLSDPLKVHSRFKHPYRRQFQELTKKYRMDIVPGSLIEEDEEGLHNIAYYIDYRGKILSRYRKIHLWYPFDKDFKPGHRSPVFKTRFGNIGLVICWDLMFPEVFRKMEKQGVRIVICPSYWTYADAGNIGRRIDKNSESKLIDALCVGRAFENEIVFVYCNAAGVINKGKYKEVLTGIGHSQIAVPLKGAIRKLNHDREAMFIQEVDTEILEAAERVYKVRKELKHFLSE